MTIKLNQLMGLITSEITLKAYGTQGNLVSSLTATAVADSLPNVASTPTPATAASPLDPEKCEGSVLRCYASVFIGLGVTLGACACTCAAVQEARRGVISGLFRPRAVRDETPSARVTACSSSALLTLLTSAFSRHHRRLLPPSRSHRLLCRADSGVHCPLFAS
jgi:hypothetical protein